MHMMQTAMATISSTRRVTPCDSFRPACGPARVTDLLPPGGWFPGQDILIFFPVPYFCPSVPYLCPPELRLENLCENLCYGGLQGR